MSQSKRIFPPYLIGFVLAAIVVFVVGLVIVGPATSATASQMTAEAIAARMAPVSSIELAAAGGAPHPARAGEAVYSGLCVACHGAGVAGSPKLGDKSAWKPRIAQGFETLVKHATEGYKGMPPKGGGADLDPQEVARAVAWMADQGGASFKEP